MMESYIPAATGARLARALRTAALAGLTIGLTACSVFGIRTAEEARYRVLSTDGEFELREYENHVVAQTLVEATFDDAGGIAFGRLFRYISGENAGNAEMAMTAPVLVDPTVSGEKIEMTAPVIGRPVATGWRYQFVLPAEYTAANTPTPTDPAVTIEVVPKSRVAALRFSGSSSEAGIREKTDRMLAWLTANNFELASQPRWAGYDPPWTIPFLRRNEILVEVE
jgi:hypothetical protein